MKAIILAAGRGSRMGDLTEDSPKCLVTVAGQTLLAWQMAALRAAAVEDVVLVRGYAKDRLGGQPVRFVDNPRWARTNMVGTLLCAERHLRRDDAIVAYADIVYHPDIVATLAAAAGDIVVAYDTLWRDLWCARFAEPLADAETFETRDGRLVEIGGRATALDDIRGQFMGLMKFTPAGWRRTAAHLAGLAQPERDRLDSTALLSRLLAAGVEVRTLGVAGRWCEFDSQRDLDLCESMLNGGRQGRWAHDWR